MQMHLAATAGRQLARCQLKQSCSSRHLVQRRLACLPADATTQATTSSAAAAAADAGAWPPELAGFRPNVGVCLVNKHGLVFAATRVDDPGKSWQMPQGGIDPGETPLNAAVRELFEETNISSVELLAEAPAWLTYEFPTHVRCKLSGSWAQYKGQAQRWFLFRFTGNDSEVNLDTSHKEFLEWRWMPLQELPGAVIEFKQSVYEAVAAEFGPVVEAIKGSGNGH